MTDPRLKLLCDRLIGYSTRIKPGEKVLLRLHDCEEILLEELVDAVYRAGGIPFTDIVRTKVERRWLKGLTEEGIRLYTKFDRARFDAMDAYIVVKGDDNVFERSDVPEEKLALYRAVMQKSLYEAIDVNHTKWVVLGWPGTGMAQLSGMSTRAFEDFYFDVCTLDYAKMDAAFGPLKALMERTDRVRITAKDTDISFSIKGMPAVKCAGEFNIPDGEIYTAPVKDSVNGYIHYNTPSVYQGTRYDNVRLTFKNGRITECTGSDSARIKGVFDTDEGARYVGEFAIGVNPYVTRPMCDTLFDEKISGSIHLTPGNSYEDADNGNKSSVHWDLVLMQTPEYGGGEIWFDDVLIRKDGRFVLPELFGLNPENLK